MTPEEALEQATALAQRAHDLNQERDDVLGKMFDVLWASGHPNVNYECMRLLENAKKPKP